MAIRSLITWLRWNYWALFRCQTWHLSDGYSMSPPCLSLRSLRNDSHVRCRVKQLTSHSQHLIFALQVTISHCCPEMKLRWFNVTTAFSKNKIMVKFSSLAQKMQSCLNKTDKQVKSKEYNTLFTRNMLSNHCKNYLHLELFDQMKRRFMIFWRHFPIPIFFQSKYYRIKVFLPDCAH